MGGGGNGMQNETNEIREEINFDTTLRLQIALHYARMCTSVFPDQIDSNNLAISFGAIIGSLQGGDPTSPEVAVVVAALEFVGERLNETFQNDDISLVFKAVWHIDESVQHVSIIISIFTISKTVRKPI